MIKLCGLSRATTSDFRLPLASPIAQKHLLLTSPRDSKSTEFKTVDKSCKKKNSNVYYIIHVN